MEKQWSTRIASLSPPLPPSVKKLLNKKENEVPGVALDEAIIVTPALKPLVEISKKEEIALTAKQREEKARIEEMWEKKTKRRYAEALRKKQEKQKYADTLKSIENAERICRSQKVYNFDTTQVFKAVPCHQADNLGKAAMQMKMEEAVENVFLKSKEHAVDDIEGYEDHLETKFGKKEESCHIDYKMIDCIPKFVRDNYQYLFETEKLDYNFEKSLSDLDEADDLLNNAFIETPPKTTDTSADDSLLAKRCDLRTELQTLYDRDLKPLMLAEKAASRREFRDKATDVPILAEDKAVETASLDDDLLKRGIMGVSQLKYKHYYHNFMRAKELSLIDSGSPSDSQFLPDLEPSEYLLNRHAKAAGALESWQAGNTIETSAPVAALSSYVKSLVDKRLEEKSSLLHKQDERISPSFLEKAETVSIPTQKPAFWKEKLINEGKPEISSQVTGESHSETKLLPSDSVAYPKDLLKKVLPEIISKYLPLINKIPDASKSNDEISHVYHELSTIEEMSHNSLSFSQLNSEMRCIKQPDIYRESSSSLEEKMPLAGGQSKNEDYFHILENTSILQAQTPLSDNLMPETLDTQTKVKEYFQGHLLENSSNLVIPLSTELSKRNGSERKLDTFFPHSSGSFLPGIQQLSPEIGKVNGEFNAAINDKSPFSSQGTDSTHASFLFGNEMISSLNVPSPNERGNLLLSSESSKASSLQIEKEPLQHAKLGYVTPTGYSTSSEDNLPEMFLWSKNYYHSTPVQSIEELAKEPGILEEPELTLVDASCTQELDHLYDSTMASFCETIAKKGSNELSVPTIITKSLEIPSTTVSRCVTPVENQDTLRKSPGLSESMASFLRHEKSAFETCVPKENRDSDRKLFEEDYKFRTKRLWNNLEEVKQAKLEEERKKTKAVNRERAREFMKKLRTPKHK